ncbi:hypothetical protein ACI2L1_17715 [Streptomyces sp. NPDC019531]|uniref:hypothetical protein n=1 Tax=Streptomyces sp. NPDC019531 TaxID=3365062 RepID=UPI00384F8109
MTGSVTEAVRAAEEPDDEPFDLLSAIGMPVARRVAAAVAAAAVVVLAITGIRRRPNRRV